MAASPQADNKRLKEELAQLADDLRTERAQLHSALDLNHQLKDRLALVQRLTMPITTPMSPSIHTDFFGAATIKPEPQRAISPSRSRKDMPAKKDKRRGWLQSGSTPAVVASSGGRGRLDPVVTITDTRLHDACGEDNVAAVQILLDEGGFSLNSMDKNGWTPLHCAASCGSIGITLLLLTQDGVNTSLTNKDGNTPLHYFVRHHGTNNPRYLDALKMMIEHPTMDLGLANTNGETALHASALRGNLTAVNFLLTKGCDPNVVNSLGESPLHYAVRSSRIDLVRELLRFGADPTIHSMDESGTPLAIARRMKSKDIVELLEDPNYCLVPQALYSVGLEQYLPAFVGFDLSPQEFRSMTKDQLANYLPSLTPDKQKMLLELLRNMREQNTPAIDLAWMVNWDALTINSEVTTAPFGVVFRGVCRKKECLIYQIKDVPHKAALQLLDEVEKLFRGRRHAHLVTIYGICKSPHIAIIQEDYPLGTLDEWVATHAPVALVQTCSFLRATAAALQLLHLAGLPHKDVACHSLFVVQDRAGETTVLLGNYGLAQFSTNLSSALGQRLLYWRAPEALSGKWEIASDMWSLGVTIVELLRDGDDPYPGESAIGVAAGVAAGTKFPTAPPLHPSKRDMPLFQGLSSLVKRCCANAPAERISAEEFVTATSILLLDMKRS